MNAPRKQSTFRFTEGEKSEIQRLANLYTRGNTSEWVRYAATHFRPAPGEFFDSTHSAEKCLKNEHICQDA